MRTSRFLVAFLIPPFAVALQEGLSWRYWLTLMLTTIGFVPGVLCALIMLFLHETRPFSGLHDRLAPG